MSYHDFTPLFPQGNFPIVEGPSSQQPYEAYDLPPVNSRGRRNLRNAKDYTIRETAKAVMKKQNQQKEQEKVVNARRTQALMLLSRIYIGSIGYEINDNILRTAFGPFGPIKNISLSVDPVTQKHKGFCFLDYELPEAAELAVQQMNSMPMGGRNLKVGRPTNIPQAQPILNEIMEECNLSTRIYIASVNHNLADTDIRSVFEAFGSISNVYLIPDGTGQRHRGFGFIEYDNAQAAQDAVNSMNLFDLGGQLLRVGKAVTPPNLLLSVMLGSAEAAADACTKAAISLDRSTNSNSGNSSLPSSAAYVAANITAKIIAKQADKLNKSSSSSNPSRNHYNNHY